MVSCLRTDLTIAMAQKSLETSGHPQFGPLFSSSDLEIDDMKPGITFPDEDTAAQACLLYRLFFSKYPAMM